MLFHSSRVGGYAFLTKHGDAHGSSFLNDVEIGPGVGIGLPLPLEETPGYVLAGDGVAPVCWIVFVRSAREARIWS